MIDFAAVILQVLASIGWGVVGVLIFYMGVQLYDKLDPIDYRVEIERGNVAAAIKLAAVILGLAAITVAVIVG